MPDLESKIAAWRAELVRRMPDRDETIQELEEHLRDEIDAQIKSGTEPSAAFAFASARIGKSQALAFEFSRADERWFCLPKAALAIYGTVGLFSAACLFLLLKDFRGREFGALFIAHSFFLMTGYLCVLGIGVLGLGAVVTGGRRSRNDQEHRESRRAIFLLTAAGCAFAAVGLVLGQLWLMNHPEASRWESPLRGGSALLAALVLMALAQMPHRFSRAFRISAPIIGDAAFLLISMGTRGFTAGVPASWLFIALVVSQAGLLALGLRRKNLEAPVPA